MADCGVGWFVCFGHSTGKVPVGFVGGIDEQDGVVMIEGEGVGADSLTGLACIAFGEVLLPGVWVARMERPGVAHELVADRCIKALSWSTSVR